MEWKFDLNFDALEARVDEVAPEALAQAMEHVRAAAVERTPIETGNLAGSAAVHVDGDEASITYDGPYARYQHERLDLRHEHGQAKFLESALADEKDKAIEILAEQIRRAL